MSLNGGSGQGTYTLQSSHYVLPIDMDDSGLLYEDPCGFDDIGTSSGGSVVRVDGTCGEENYDFDGTMAESIEVAATEDTGTTAAKPIITRITPSGLTLNSSGTLQIYGTDLADGGSPTVAVVSGTGLAFTGNATTANSDNDGEIDVPYTVDGNGSSSGPHSITVTSGAGTSDPFSITVGDPTPAITSIMPNQWQAGNDYSCSITIQGTGFGNNTPSVQLSDGSIGSPTVCSVNSEGTSITFSLNVSPTAPSENISVRVVSNGYTGSSGSGFLPVNTTNTSAPSTVTILPTAPIAFPPTIMMGGSTCIGTSVGGTTLSVLVGQQIAITGCLPAGIPLSSVTSISWTPVTPQGNAVGGYNASTNSGTVTKLSSPSCSTTQAYCSFPAFYWIDQANGLQFTFSYTLTGGGTGTSNVAFNVGGPTIATPITTQVGYAHATMALLPGQTVSQPIEGLLGMNPPFLNGGEVGIVFSTPASPAPGGETGTYLWVQVVTRDGLQIRTSGGTLTCSPKVPVVFPALDNHFPYGTKGGNLFSVSQPNQNDTATDNPYISLSPAWGETQRLFAATMYLMWDPTLPSGCVAASASGPSTSSSIPIPIASVAWQSGADGINTLQTQLPPNGTQWSVPCGPGTAGSCAVAQPGTDPSQSFPRWTNPYVNGSYNCK
jgi:hypothetical protein